MLKSEVANRHNAMDILVVESEVQATQMVVDLLAHTLVTNTNARIGIATGGTMVPIYREIASRYADRKLSLTQVEAFQLDEYFPIDPWHPQSYRMFLKRHLLDVTDLPPTNLNVLNGATHDPTFTCKQWEAWLHERPMDLQLLGIGIEGHIAFVEALAESTRTLYNSRTMRIDLNDSTLRENGRYFAPGQFQPTQALTVGIGTLLEVVRHFILVAFGTNKSTAIAAALLDEVNDRCPASYLREAPGRVTIVLDLSAGAEFLERVAQYDTVPSHLNLSHMHELAI